MSEVTPDKYISDDDKDAEIRRLRAALDVMTFHVDQALLNATDSSVCRRHLRLALSTCITKLVDRS